MPSLRQVILALVVAIIAYLICVFIGGLMATTGIPIAAFVGGFLVQWATLISILVFVWYLFAGGGITLGKPSA